MGDDYDLRNSIVALELDGRTPFANRVALPHRASSEDFSAACGMFFSGNNDPRTAEAFASALVAREQRKAAVGVAELLVRAKEIDAMAQVETTRLIERGSTDRTKIEQEQQSIRFQRMANVMDLATTEDAQTSREATVLVEQTKREAISAHERVENVRIKTSAWHLGTLRYVFAAMLGAIVVRGVGRRGRRRRSYSILSPLAIMAALIVLVWRVDVHASTYASWSFYFLQWFGKLLRSLLPRVIVLGNSGSANVKALSTRSDDNLSREQNKHGSGSQPCVL